MRTSTITSASASIRCSRWCADALICRASSARWLRIKAGRWRAGARANRLELGAQEINLRTRKIQAHREKIEALLLRRGVAAIPRKSDVIILDFDAADDPIHGHQEGRFHHGCHGAYCCLPLYCFCGDVAALGAVAHGRSPRRRRGLGKLAGGRADGAEGALDALKKIVAAIRERFGRHTRIIVRGERGFCRDALMTWIEARENVHYLLGLARNSRLERMLAPAFWDTAALLEEDLVLCARAAGAQTPPKVEGTARTFAELRCQTRESWSRERLLARPPASLFPSSSSVIGKAEITNGENNPGHLVTDIPLEAPWIKEHAALADGRALYEDCCCARGDMENRIKEQQLDMFAGRTSTAYLSSNQLRLWFSTFACLLMSQLRTVALAGTRMARATVGTIRLHLMKIAAQVTASVRRVCVRLSSSSPAQEVFAQAPARLRAAGS